MSVRSERGQEEEVGGGVEGDLQEANMSLPRLVSRQTANIPPMRRNNSRSFASKIQVMVEPPVAIPRETS